MAASTLLSALKILILAIFAGWVCVWVLMPTGLWIKLWHAAEDSARKTIFGYSSVNFVVLSFPIILLAILGFICLHMHSGERRSRTLSVPKLSNPAIIRSPLGLISLAEILAASVFIIFLTWTYYYRVSNDFKKMIPNKSLHLNIWQYKVMRIGTRLGSLSEACLALLLLPILRGLSVFQLLGIQFEASVRYHIWLGNGMLLFSALHGLITMFVWGVKHNLGYELVQWQLTGRVNLAGEISLAVGLIIWITSLPQIRRKWFELFYYTHHLYLVFIIFFLFHAGDRHFYTVLSGVILFALDKLLRVIQSRQVTSLISARLLPCRALELTLSKHPGLKYSPTSVIFINVPSISVLQWHPFSLTSSPSVDKDTISVLIKCQGQWTNELYRKVHEATNLEASSITMNLPVAVEGPYGPSSIYYQRYDGLLLIAGGIGITPFISILREIYLNGSDNNSLNKSTTRVQLIYVVKKTQDLSMLNSVSALFLDKSTNKGLLKLKIYVTQEEKSSTNLRDQLQELSQVQTLFFDATHSKYSMPSPESYLWKAAIAGIFSIIFVASFMCLNHAFLRPEKPSSKKKNPSWISDLIIIFSFTIATICSTSILLLLRWRKRKNEISVLSQKQAKGTELQSIAEQCRIEENEIYFGQRPDFQDIFSKFSTNMGRSEIGVLVSGPESMQESVACCCRQHTRNFNIDSKVKGASFSYNSLSFSL